MDWFVDYLEHYNYYYYVEYPSSLAIASACSVYHLYVLVLTFE